MLNNAPCFPRCYADLGALMEGSKRQCSEQPPPAARQQQRQRQPLGLLRPSAEEEQEAAAAAAEAAVEIMPPPSRKASAAQMAEAGLSPRRQFAEKGAQTAPKPVLLSNAVQTGKPQLKLVAARGAQTDEAPEAAASGGTEEGRSADGGAACAQAQAAPPANQATDTVGLPLPESSAACEQTSPSVFRAAAEVQVGNWRQGTAAGRCADITALSGGKPASSFLLLNASLLLRPCCHPACPCCRRLLRCWEPARRCRCTSGREERAHRRAAPR